MRDTISNMIYQNAGNEFVLGLIPSNHGRVLDIGCGAGDNARVLLARGHCVDGITLSEGEALLAGEFCSRVFIKDLDDGLPVDLAPSYDLILASHVLEHIREPDVLLREVRHHLAENGILVVALPNTLNWRYRWRFLLGRFDYESSGVMDSTHVRWFTYLSGCRLLEECGFEVFCSRAEGYVPLPFFRKLLPSFLVRCLDRFASKRWPGLFGIQLVYIARRSIGHR